MSTKIHHIEAPCGEAKTRLKWKYLALKAKHIKWGRKPYKIDDLSSTLLKYEKFSQVNTNTFKNRSKVLKIYKTETERQ